MDRRLVLKGLFGLAGAAAAAAILPLAEAQAGIPRVGPPPEPSVPSDLEELKAAPEAELEEGVQLASHRNDSWGHDDWRRRRWRRRRWRRRRWRYQCRRYWRHGRWRRRCRRRPYWDW